MINEGIFREYDIRGIVGKDLSRDLAILIGRSVVSFIKMKNPSAKCLSVGRDIRHSSADLASGLIQGIISTGMDVCDIGICPTPLQYFSLFHLNLDGGIMVTGSHNPPEYNGFKICAGKDTIHGNDIQRIKELILREERICSAQSGIVKNYNIVDAYKSYMLNEFQHLRDVKYKKLRVVIDSGNGTAGIVAPDIINKIGCEVFPLYSEPDGNFPNHHPDPTVIENIRDLIAETRKNSADMGVGYDGDADRIGIVNSDGDIVWGDQIMIVLSRELLKQSRGAKIIGDVKCSQTMFDDIKINGGVPIMGKTGHSLIKQKMRDEGALMAGEFSGHIFIKDRYYGYDDAIYTTLRLIEIMKTTGLDIKGLLSGVPRMFYTPEIRLNCPDDKKRGAVERLIAKLAEYVKNRGCPCRIRDLITIDGVRVVFEKGWGLVRASNTQPVVVMRAEAEDEKSLNDYRVFLECEFNAALEEN